MKFLYIVDHPSRDLPSYAWWVTSSGFHSSADTVALISMNDINRDIVFKSKFDVIIWNYARPENINLIRDAFHLGIYNIVHDSEGIPYDLSTYFTYLKRSDFTYINEIWTWGKLQLEHLQNRFSRESITTLIKNTGSIRYAYANQLPKVSTCIQKNALWNTNFPIISPKYNTFENEFRALYQKHQYPMSDCLDVVRVASECRVYAIYKCMEIASSLPDLNIILRTHPFESKDYYQTIMADIDFSISADQDVNDDIYSSSFVLHSGCQTSLDAYFRGVPSFVFSHSNGNIWSSTSCTLPSDLTLLMNTDFLCSCLSRQRQLFSEFNVDLYLSNLYDDYDHLLYFKLNYFVNLSTRFRGFWIFYFFLRKASRLLLRPFLLIIQKKSSRTRSPATKKLSSMDIASYLKNTYKLTPSILSHCVYTSPY